MGALHTNTNRGGSPATGSCKHRANTHVQFSTMPKTPDPVHSPCIFTAVVTVTTNNMLAGYGPSGQGAGNCYSLSTGNQTCIPLNWSLPTPTPQGHPHSTYSSGEVKQAICPGLSMNPGVVDPKQQQWHSKGLQCSVTHTLKYHNYRYKETGFMGGNCFAVCNCNSQTQEP